MHKYYALLIIATRELSLDVGNELGPYVYLITHQGESEAPQNDGSVVPQGRGSAVVPLGMRSAVPQEGGARQLPVHPLVLKFCQGNSTSQY